MASRAILRRRNIFSDFSVLPVRGQSCQSFDSHSFSSAASHFSQTTYHRKENQETSVLIKELLSFSNLGIFRHKDRGSTSFHYGNGRLDFNCVLGVRLMSQSTRYADTETAKKLDLGSEDKEMAAKKKEEASPDECDQAVMNMYFFPRFSFREDWAKDLVDRNRAKKLFHRKNEFVSTLNEGVNDLKIYMVFVQPPDGKSFTDSEELEKWYDSFLPENTPNSRMIEKFEQECSCFVASLSADEVEAIKKHKDVLDVQPDGFLVLHSPTSHGLQQNFGFWKDSNYGFTIGNETPLDYDGHDTLRSAHPDWSPADVFVTNADHVNPSTANDPSDSSTTPPSTPPSATLASPPPPGGGCNKHFGWQE